MEWSGDGSELSWHGPWRVSLVPHQTYLQHECRCVAAAIARSDASVKVWIDTDDDADALKLRGAASAGSSPNHAFHLVTTVDVKSSSQDNYQHSHVSTKEWIP